MTSPEDELLRLLDVVFGDSRAPNPLHILQAINTVRSRQLSAPEAARLYGASVTRVKQALESHDLIGQVAPAYIEPPTEQITARARRMLGQLVIGNVAESVFESLYRETVGTSDLQLIDDREARGETDYLVLNGLGRQVFRINIKFHGALFRRAQELVGLDPQDCFALATYKIYAALQRQDEELLPYIFVIVGVRGLMGETVGEEIPLPLVKLAALPRQTPGMSGVRQIEDRIVQRLTTAPAMLGFDARLREYTRELREADWYVLSARRANALLVERLFDRAYALRVPRFAANYRNAELDMHFSLSQDLTPLIEFFRVLRDSGMPGLVTRLERGTL